MLTCKQASQFISQSLDRPLTLRERLALKLHLLICKYCKRFSQQLVSMRVALETMTKMAENDNSIEMPKESKRRIAENVKKHLA